MNQNKKTLISKLKKKWPIILIVILGISIGIYFLVSSNESIYVGTIEVTEVHVAPRTPSQIKERIVDEGDIVKAGDTLYTLTCEDQIIAAEKSTNDYGRAGMLLASGNMPPEVYDAYKKTYDDSKLNVEWCTVKAPVNGTILTKFHEAGEYVYTGTKLMSMGDLTDVWAYIYVDQPLLVSLSIGQNVTGYLPELSNKLIAGKIIHIKDEAEFTPKNVQTRKERTRLVFGVKIRFDNSENLLKPGMPIEVRF